MESRKNLLTTSGEGQDLSPRDWKAVSDTSDFMALTEETPSVNYPLYNLIPDIIAPDNLLSSFKRVLSNLREASTAVEKREENLVEIEGKKYTKRQARYVMHKESILSRLAEQIGNGTFRVKHLKSFLTKDGPKIRTVQAPAVVERMGGNAIMEVVENRLAPVLIQNTAASIKGRGPHGLFHEIQAAIEANPKLIYYYQADYKGYYDHIRHDLLIAQIKKYIADPILLPMLISFVKALNPEGNTTISKGLRASQFFGQSVSERPRPRHDRETRSGVLFQILR